ncbi:unnamed protein product [Lactuca virosa]|uniref:t-SNARE coiled-coil homology domain-containing protein n=1 Tax=Lactuca virosa TaxID=75947 RepID=A0AAU9PI62_9ASTR|nr:unnamed protein product [Lactuca virosa]
MEKNVTNDVGVVTNEENRGREEIRQGASKGQGKSKNMWRSLDKRLSEMETSLETLRDQVEDAHQQMGVMTSDNDEMQDNVSNQQTWWGLMQGDVWITRDAPW